MVHKQNRGQRCPERCEDERKTLPVPYAHKRKELLHHSHQVTRKKRTIEVTRWPDSCLMAHHLKLTHTHTPWHTQLKGHTLIPTFYHHVWNLHELFTVLQHVTDADILSTAYLVVAFIDPSISPHIHPCLLCQEWAVGVCTVEGLDGVMNLPIHQRCQLQCELLAFNGQ